MIDEGLIRVFGKGSKERIVPIGNMALSHIKIYLQELRPQLSQKGYSQGVFFLNSRGKKLTRMSIWNILHENTVRSGVDKKVSPHIIRHSFATHLLERGADLKTIQQLLGHADISTVQIYTRVQNKHLKRMVDKKHPLSVIKVGVGKN